MKLIAGRDWVETSGGDICKRMDLPEGKPAVVERAPEHISLWGSIQPGKLWIVHEPSLESKTTGQFFKCGEIFGVSEEVTKEGVTYLLLNDGRGRV